MAETKTITSTAGVGAVVEGPEQVGAVEDETPSAPVETRSRALSKANPSMFAPVEDDHPLASEGKPKAQTPSKPVAGSGSGSTSSSGEAP